MTSQGPDKGQKQRGNNLNCDAFVLFAVNLCHSPQTLFHPFYCQAPSTLSSSFSLLSRYIISKEEAESSMASSSSSGSGSSDGDGSPPISRTGEDHLFTILLLLPVESILSFSFTCKKFRSLACSDSLWESVCRREWGPASVDALRSSYLLHDGHGTTDGRLNKFPSSWIKIYRQVSRLDSIACHNLLGLELGQEDSALPSPRASHSLNFVSDSLVVFGGGCEGGNINN